MSATKYAVTKRFTDGSLAGLTIREVTSVKFEVGETIKSGPWTGPGYIVEAVEEVAAVIVASTHDGYEPGDTVRFRIPSIVNGQVVGYGPEQTAAVVRLARNGYLTVREPKFGTTFDVAARNCQPGNL